MFFHACPHCGNSGVSTLRKFFLSPLRASTCRSCGQSIRLSRKAYIFIYLPVICMVVLGVSTDTRSYRLAGVAIAITVALFAFAVDRIVPLVKA